MEESVTLQLNLRNSTTREQESVPSEDLIHKNVTLVIYCVAFLLGTTGNGLVIYVTGFKMKKTVNTIWFLNLAVADFTFTAFLPFSIVEEYGDRVWPFGDFMCKFNNLVTVLNMFTSIFLLTAISLDRCLATWVVVWAKNKRTPHKAQITCTVIWLAGLGCSLPYTIIRKTVTSGVTTCEYTNISLTTHRHLAIFSFVGGFVVPFLIITCSYIAIGIRIRSLQRKRSSKPIRIILAVISTFFICWLPFHIFQILLIEATINIYDYSEYTWHVLQTGATLSSSLAFLNSCLNPFLYVFMCEDFKSKLRQSVFSVLEGAFSEDIPFLGSIRRSSFPQQASTLSANNE